MMYSRAFFSPQEQYNKQQQAGCFVLPMVRLISRAGYKKAGVCACTISRVSQSTLGISVTQEVTRVSVTLGQREINGELVKTTKRNKFSSPMVLPESNAQAREFVVTDAKIQP